MASWSPDTQPRNPSGLWLVACAFVCLLAWVATAIAWRLGGGS